MITLDPKFIAVIFIVVVLIIVIIVLASNKARDSGSSSRSRSHRSTDSDSHSRHETRAINVTETGTGHGNLSRQLPEMQVSAPAINYSVAQQPVNQAPAIENPTPIAAATVPSPLRRQETVPKANPVQARRTMTTARQHTAPERSTRVQSARLDAPILRCYDYFEFPKEGSFHVKTCGAPGANQQDDNGNINTKPPTRIFLQWFPVRGAAQYAVYGNAGPDVSTSNYSKKWPVSGSSHYFESEPLVGSSCWSMVVAAVNKDGQEGLPSAVYSTCQV